MLNFKKILIILASVCLISIFCIVEFDKQVSINKAKYSSQLTEKIDEYLQQQAYILQRLGKNLIPSIKHNNFNKVAENLGAYEDILFAVAKQDLAIPLSLQLVSLDAPQKTIGALGSPDSSAIAADESYYIGVVEQPNILKLSKSYTKQDMPDYVMANLGLGVVDDANRYVGHLDGKLAVATLHAHIANKLRTDSKLFGFKFSNENLRQPEIYIVSSVYWLLFMQYLALRLMLIILLGLSVWMLYKLYKYNEARNLELSTLNKKLQIVTKDLASAKAAIEVQNTYGLLVKHNINTVQVIEIQQLLNDIKAVNANLAVEQGVKLIFPEYNSQILRFYGRRVRLMQILSGIVHEMIMQNAIGGILELKLSLSDSADGKQKVSFIFNDNGFYNALYDSGLESSASDIRCKGWNNILQLIEQDGDSLEHVHTVYVGNIVTFVMFTKHANNVIHLEEYCQNV